MDQILESLLWGLLTSAKPEVHASIIADRLEELGDGRAGRVRQRLSGSAPEGYHDRKQRAAAIWGFWVQDLYWQDMSKESAVRATVGDLLALFPESRRTVQAGEAVTLPGVRCPECGGVVLVSVESWGEPSMSPCEIAFDCHNDDRAARHRWHQSDWQPVKDAAHRWAKAFLRVAD